MDALPSSVPSEALGNVSVPFCFICLLHLANEHNLSLDADSDRLGDFHVRQNLQ
jgi:condensin complex subunit 2